MADIVHEGETKTMPLVAADERNPKATSSWGEEPRYMINLILAELRKISALMAADGWDVSGLDIPADMNTVIT